MKVILEKIKSYKSIALVQNNKEISYQDIYEKFIEKKEFLEKNKVTNNSIVCIEGEYSLDTIALLFASIGIGAICVPMTTTVKNKEKYLEISETTHFIKSPYTEVINTKKKIKHSELLKLSKSNDSGIIFFSSGTTGEPKASLHNLSFILKAYKETKKNFTSIAFLLFDHIGGFNTLMYSLSNGGKLILTKERSTDKICSLIQKYKVEVLPTTPSFLNLLLLSKNYKQYDLTSLKVFTYGTEPMAETILNQLNNIFPKVNFKQTYGLSEIGILRTKSKNNNSLFMKIGDETHKIKVIDNILYIKSNMSMICYLNAPSPFDEDGYFNTHDSVIIEDEYIKILGRDSDIINVGGEKVYPSEVENIILTSDKVANVLVKKEPNIILGNIVIALINKFNEEDEDSIVIEEIKKLCKKTLEKYKRPLKIIITKKKLLSNRLKKQR